MLVYDPVAIGLDISSISGNEVQCLCPFHSDTHPSASFNVRTGLFVCYSCHKGSNARQLARKLGGAAALVSATKLQLSIRELDDQEWKHVLTFPKAFDVPYLQKRKVTNEQVEEFNILHSSKGIIIPVNDRNGITQGAILRRFDNSPRYMFYGDKLSLWPLNKFDSQKPLTKVFIVEGIFGALRARKYGIPAFATMGAMVKRETKQLLQSRYPVVVFDNDYAGMLGAARLLVMIPTTKVIVPGMEADELDKFEWNSLFKEGYATRDLSVLARLSRNASDFYRSIKSFIKKDRGENESNNWRREEKEENWTEFSY